jgi:chromosome partitioning protein
MSKSIDEEELPPKSEYIRRMGNADLISCCILLSVVDANLRSEMGSEKLLANILDPLRSDYDYIIIDTSPSLGALTINALSAADTVIITVNPQLLAVMGLEDLTKTILKIKRRINPRIGFEGILLTMCDTRTNLYKEISAQVGEAYRSGMRIFDSQIPSSVKVGEANRYGMSVMEYDKKSKAGLAYMDFAKELSGYAG